MFWFCFVGVLVCVGVCFVFVFELATVGVVCDGVLV